MTMKYFDSESLSLAVNVSSANSSFFIGKCFIGEKYELMLGASARRARQSHGARAQRGVAAAAPSLAGR